MNNKNQRSNFNINKREHKIYIYIYRTESAVTSEEIDNLPMEKPTLVFQIGVL